MVAQINHQLS